MNLDNLISKYLDGELTHQEDLYLRELISNDELARDTFNSYVDIHLAAKEDSKDIEIPEDLVSDTEDKVLMKIMNQTPVSNRTVSASIFRSFSFKISSMVAAILIFAVLPISDINFFNTDRSNQSLVERRISLIEIEVPEVSISSRGNSLEEDNGVHTESINASKQSSLASALQEISSDRINQDELPASNAEESEETYLVDNRNEEMNKGDATIYFEDKSENKERIISSKPVSVHW